MILATIALAACPAFAVGDSEPVTLPPGCALTAIGIWRTPESEARIDDAVAALRRCAANEARAAVLLREVPDPPSRVSWALAGVAVGAAAAIAIGAAW